MELLDRLEKLEKLIGNTPLQEIQNIGPTSSTRIFAKLEGNNPGGSVKDRPAFNMIKAAIQSGELTANRKIIEATSGNTGIGLALVASVLGLDLTLLMPENSTKERVQVMRAYGANLILTDADKGIEYTRELADTMAAEEGYLQINQFANDANWQAHYKSTGPEIWRDTGGKITHFLCTMGTTGTITGVSRYLKEQNPEIQIIGVQPEDGSSIPGIRKWSPEMVPSIFQKSKVDRVLEVNSEEAISGAKELSKQQGIFCGISTGGAYQAVKKLLQENTSEEICLVFIACDRGDRYLSLDLYQ